MPRAGAIELDLPGWSVTTGRRREHIARVTALMLSWADTLDLPARTRNAWRDAGLWHDALRDAPPERLGRPKVDPSLPRGAWHGPAAARRLRSEGERREDVLAAITWHTVGHAGWGRTGRALFCADYLEPGRPFDRRKRAQLAARFPADPDGVLRDVVRMRLEGALDARKSIHWRTVALWEVVR
jgi:2-amino-4-hydroxy-6-hydroxymethyldihydropteridine diphosphokinase